MLLLNDEMCKAYFGQMHEADYAGTHFAQTNWKSFRTPGQLNSILLNKLKLNPGITRKDMWLNIVQEHFMKFTHSEYRKSITELAKTQRIVVIYTETKRLNDDCRLRASET
jgi:hypothetical protein